MQVLSHRQEMFDLTTRLRFQGKRIGFVPTMGFLHEGHLSLVKKAREQNDVVIVSIFVNPTQFGPDEDFEKYPRNFERDCVLLSGLVDYIFYPDIKEMYSDERVISLRIAGIADCLCGVSRPNHFPGVALVLAKFFQIVQPHVVYMGQKDYQQTVVVKRLIDEIFFPVKLYVVETARDVDGLALSSRNVYLSTEERLQAVVLYKALLLGLNLLLSGEKNANLIIQKMRKLIDTMSLAKIDYVDIREADTLKGIEMVNKKVVLAVAVFFGKTRLIDNILFTP